ncbi:MAG: phasin family domain-containing protein [Micavibrio aeruginosavorus]|uniref:Phasin family domain-containing protein n=1 Tax=Micavibrio aeruginosavorus TaxID=349221 RepID=A0A2W5HSG5_9BACT|nr:MAG: phasin family domain-containing protein [Micavibrio aeruginosavorus]
MASKNTKTNLGKDSSIIPFANFANPQSLESMEKIMNTNKDHFEKFKTEAATSGRQGFEAVMKSGSVFAQGFEQYIKTVTEIAQNAAERQSEAFKQLMACKTLNEVAETQNKIAQDNFEQIMQTASKLSEITIKITQEALEPINEEVSKSVKKASESMAA